MTGKEIQLVKYTWRIFQQIDPELVGSTFYGKLFADHPNLRKMFPHQLHDQYRKLIDMLSIIIARLDKEEELKENIYRIGARHQKYGATPAHFAMVGVALIWTLQHGLGKDWDKETEDAWVKCYTMVSDVMIRAMAES